MADIIIPLDEYKKLLRLANRNTINKSNYYNFANEERLKYELDFIKMELEIANSMNKGLIIQKDILNSIPKWIVNIFKPKYDVELMHKFLKDK